MLTVGSQKIYLYRKPIHMNCSFEGLSNIVEQKFPDQLLTGAYFIFLNRPRSKIKIITWDRDGLLIFYKRLEKGRFAVDERGRTELTRREFQMLFEGIKPRSLNRRFSLK
jgi:transposase